MIDLTSMSRFTEDFVFVEGGYYKMGEKGWTNAPQHKVTLNSFYIQTAPVTQEFWELVLGFNPSMDKSCKDNPMTNVSWYDCQNFINKLNSITTKKYRLPTEAEWEYAARGGRLSKCFKFAGSDEVNEVAWHYYNSNNKIHAVKEKKPNELGLYDMSGNVWEWCNDWYGEYRIEVKYSKNPQGPDSGIQKVIRGGSWECTAGGCLVADRFDGNPDSGNVRRGFRLVSPFE